MNNFFLSLTLFLLSLSLMAQDSFDISKIKRKTIKIVNKIEAINEVMGGAVGYSGTTPEQHYNFEKLQKVSSIQELIQLTNHPNAAVRCYSYWGLCLDEKLKNSDTIFQILKRHLNDKEEIQTQFGCLGGNEFVSDFFLRLVLPRGYSTDFYMYELNNTQIKEVDNLLLWREQESFGQNSAILSLEETEENYPVVKKLVIERNKVIALPKLAAYNKAEDVEEILKFYNTHQDDDDIDRQFYFSVQYFPHQNFFSILKEKQEIELNNVKSIDLTLELYGAIASYKNQEALKLLKLPLQKFNDKIVKEEYSRILAQVAFDFSDSIYDELLWEMWEKYEDINRDSFYYLFQKNEFRAYKNAKKRFGIDTDFIGSKLKSEESEFFGFETLEEIMLNLVLKNESELEPIIINKKILESNVHCFKIYSKYVRQNPQGSYAKSLLTRLKTEWNAHVYIDIVKTLMVYHSDEINSEILLIIKSNKALSENWGGEELKKILKKHSLIKN